MALSMEERRILAQIEQHLTEAEPGLAARLSAFGRAKPGRGALGIRTAGAASAGQRARLPRGSRGWPVRPPLLLAAAAAVMMAAVAVVVYALVALRGGQSPASQSPGGLGDRSSVAPQIPAIAPRASQQAGTAGSTQP